MTEDSPERHRQDLLASLYGSEVPTTLCGDMLRTGDVAAMFQVSERTVSEWARRGRIPSVRTPGGHRRYPADELHRLLAERDSWAPGWERTPPLEPPGRRDPDAGSRFELPFPSAPAAQESTEARGTQPSPWASATEA